MTDRIAEIRKRVEAATEGPWSVDWWQGILRDFHNLIPFPDDFCDENQWNPNKTPGWGGDDMADGAFIAHAREDIPYLLDQLDAAREALRRYGDHEWSCPGYDKRNQCTCGFGEWSE